MRDFIYMRTRYYVVQMAERVGNAGAEKAAQRAEISARTPFEWHHARLTGFERK